MIKAIIFDCFGVLITDSLTKIVEDLRKVDPEGADRIMELNRVAGRGEIEAHEYRTAVAEILGITFDEYINKLRSGEVKNDELLRYIKELRQEYKIGLLSNVSKGGLTMRFADGELESYFDVVVASGDVGYAKPEARIYEIAATKLDVRLDECIMIDDREDYCEGALGVGMKAILYGTFDTMKVELSKLIEH